MAGFTTLMGYDGQFVDVPGDTMTGQLQMGDGSVGTPAQSWSSDPDTGWYWNSTGSTSYSANGVQTVILDAVESTFKTDILCDNHKIGINPSGTANAYEALTIENGNFLVQGAGEYQLFFKRVGTFGSAVNPQFKFGRIIASTPLNFAEFRILYSDDDLNQTERTLFNLESTGTLATIRDNDLGSYYEGWKKNGDTKPIFRINSSPRMGIEFGVGGSSTDTDTGIRRRAAGILTVDNGVDADGGSTLEMIELGAAPSGDTSAARIWCEDNGSGKTRLMVIFQTGAAQQLAIEP